MGGREGKRGQRVRVSCGQGPVRVRLRWWGSGEASSHLLSCFQIIE